MASIPGQVKEQRTINGVVDRSFVPSQLALSRLPRTQTNNNGIHTRFRPLAKLSTVSLVGK